jgi:hypothetical protein
MALGQPMDNAVLNEIRETVRMVKSETNTLMQKTVRNQFFYLNQNPNFPYFSQIPLSVHQLPVVIMDHV